MIKYGGKSLKTVELSFKENVLCLLLGSFSLLHGLLIKTVFPENMILCKRGFEFGKIAYYWSKPSSTDE
jgi:hypothetical protein